MVVAGDWKTVEKIKGSKTLADRGLVVTDGTRLEPRVIVYDVDVALSDADFVEAVFAQNMEESTLEEFGGSLG